MWNKINCCLCSRYKKNYKKLCKNLHQIPWKDAQCGCRKLRPCYLGAVHKQCLFLSKIGKFWPPPLSPWDDTVYRQPLKCMEENLKSAFLCSNISFLPLDFNKLTLNTNLQDRRKEQKFGDDSNLFYPTTLRPKLCSVWIWSVSDQMLFLFP